MYCGAMIVAVQFCLPSTNSRAAQGPLEAVVPPMIDGWACGVLWAAAGLPRLTTASAVLAASRTNLPNFTFTPFRAENRTGSRWGPNDKSVRVFGECPEPTKVRSHQYLFRRLDYV